MKFEDLYSIIIKRRNELPEGSYIASLIKQGEDAMLQKIGEEATEVVLAAKGKDRQRIIEEVADLYFMTLIMLAAKEIDVKTVFEELEKRRR